MNKKALVALIKKMAKVGDPPGVDMKTYQPPAAPAPAAPAASPPPPNLPPPPPPPLGTPAPTETAPGGEGAPSAPPAPAAGRPTSQAVADMQKELQALARDMTKQVNIAQLGGPIDPKTKQPVGLTVKDPQTGETREITPEQKQAYGRMSFADFITQHFTRDSDIPGVEFDWDPSKTEMTQKDPSKPTRTNVVMDTMTRIGNPTLPGQKPEFAIDGDWGPRTNASLRNAYAMAFGLLEMAKEFNFHPRAFSPRDREALKALIPFTSKEISFQEKDKRAKDIIPLLRAVRNLFQETEDHILNNTGFTPYIEGTQPYVTYGAGSAPSPAKIDELNKKFTNIRVTGNVDGRSVTLPIAVSDLVSPQTLQTWQQKNMPGVPLLNILSQIKQYLDSTGTAGGAKLQ